MKIPATSLLLLSAPLQAASLVGLWDFNDGGSLNQASIGSALGFTGTVTPTAGITVGDGAADFSKGAWAAVTNPIGANGATGTPTRTNQYTIVLDFMVPDFTDGTTDNGVYTALFDFDNGGSDADYFIKTTSVGGIGLNAASVGMNYVGTHTSVTANTWYRLVLTSDAGVFRATYLNGSLLGAHPNTKTGGASVQDEARVSLSNSHAFRLLWDNNTTGTGAEVSRVLVSNLAIFDDRLSESEIASLGAAGAAIPEPSVLWLAGIGAFAGLRRRR